MVLPDVEVGGVQVHVGEGHVIQPPLPERVDHLVERRADPGDLRAADPRAHPEGRHQLVDGPGGDPVDVGLHHHGVEGLVDARAALEHARKERALTELGNIRLHVTGLGGEETRPRRVSLGGARQGPSVALGLDHLGRLGVDQGLVEQRDHLANEVAALVAPELFEHLGQVKIMVGHRSIPFVSCNGHIKNYSGGPSSRRTKGFTPLQGTSTAFSIPMLRNGHYMGT